MGDDVNGVELFDMVALLECERNWMEELSESLLDWERFRMNVMNSPLDSDKLVEFATSQR
jgi:hypothetical protein